jgi:hypothetical protein
MSVSLPIFPCQRNRRTMAVATLKNHVALHRNNPSIAINDLPKTADLKRVFPELYRPIMRWW